jgi:hypothetical protein
MIVHAPSASRPLLPPRPPEPRTTTNVPSGYSFILLQIRTPVIGVHPLDLSIGVHSTVAREPRFHDVHSSGTKAAEVLDR